jgi:hypothetical protein
MIPCPDCDGCGFVSGGELSGGWHVPAHCYTCLGEGMVDTNMRSRDIRPKLPQDKIDEIISRRKGGR